MTREERMEEALRHIEFRCSLRSVNNEFATIRKIAREALGDDCPEGEK